jgi:UDP-glucose 4-epimerase
MKVLVTGGVGFVGTNLIKRLLSDGHDVVSVDNYSMGKKENEQEGCVYHDIDLSETPLEMIRMDRPDVIFHLAARARIVPSIQNPAFTLFNNLNSTIRVLDYARSKKVPVVYAGSSSAHGDLYANPYTFSKWNGEELCKLYESVYNLPITICRFYNVYGDHQLTEGAYCTVLGIFETQFKNNKTLTVTGDGEQRRDFTYVGDIVDGLVRCGNALSVGFVKTGKELWESVDGVISGEIFELGNGKNYSINELADAFGDYPREYIPKRPGEVRESLNVDTKANDVLGWKPKGDIIEYIDKNYRRKNENN